MTEESPLIRAARLVEAGDITAAVHAYSAAAAANPHDPVIRNNLGWALERCGRLAEALEQYRVAFAGRPGDATVRRNMAMCLTSLDRHAEARPLWVTDLTGTDDGVAWMDRRIGEEMKAGRLSAAAAMAAAFAVVRHGVDDATSSGERAATKPWRAARQISLSKLEHDSEQLRHLQRRGVLPKSWDETIAGYDATVQRLAHIGVDGRVPLDDEALCTIGPTYGRLVHLAPAPEVDRALSDRWSPSTAEKTYLEHPAGVVVIDDFLSASGLAGIQRFVEDSTIWFANRYTHGRLGAFFRDGFNAPLLLQIANELREAMPRIIGNRHPLRQMWGFKNAPTVPADASVHADFAAVNVNLWITPTVCNIDPGSGGLVLYDVGAPPDWDFVMYNGRHDLIREYLRRARARAMIVPYRCNRAVIFNSDLFHETQAVRFVRRYTGRRVNVTFLYGEREQDADHPMCDLSPQVASLGGGLWRSSAVRRSSAVGGCGK